MEKKYSWGVKITASLIFGLLLLILTTLVLEVICRQGKYGLAGFTYEEDILWRMVPNKVSDQTHYPEEHYKLTFNSRGFHDKERNLKKNPNQQRVLVLGDSYTAGNLSPLKKIFPTRLEGYLNQDGKDKYEVMSCGVPSWGTDQEWLFMKKEGVNYKPDQVVWMISPNDIRETYCKKHVTLDEENNLVVHPNKIPLLDRFYWYLSTKSSLYQAIQQKRQTHHGTFFKIFEYYPVNFGKEDAKDWDLPIFMKDPIPEVQEAYQLFERLLVELKALCDANDIQLSMAIIPTKSAFEGNYNTDRHAPDVPSNFVDSMSVKYQIPAANLYEKLKLEENPLDIFISWEHHFSREGHDWIAKQLATSLFPKTVPPHYPESD